MATNISRIVSNLGLQTGFGVNNGQNYSEYYSPLPATPATSGTVSILPQAQINFFNIDSPTEDINLNVSAIESLLVSAVVNINL